MKIKHSFFFVLIAVLIFGCSSKNNKEQANDSGMHKVVVTEVLQANAYTYLNVEEKGKNQWIAVPKMEAEVGQVYYFDGFMEMNNFESKDLARTFESVYFIQELLTEPVAHEHTAGDGHNHEATNGHMSMDKHTGKPNLEQKEVKVEPAVGGITVGELFGNKEKYNGKKVKIRGKVVKLNYEIMNKNWFHIQDGTSAGSEFDLTITSLEGEVELNDVLTFEGTIVLDKDFGYGYAYKVLMEEAVIVR